MKRLLTLLLTLSITAFANVEILDVNEDNLIVFNEAFSMPYIAKKQQEFIDKSAKNPEMDLYLFLYTPGGDIGGGNLLFDTIKALPNKVHTITLFAASMGYNTVQQLDTRYILPSGTLMSHRARVGGISGQVPGEANTSINFVGLIVDEMETIAAKRVGLIKKDYQNLVRDEFWTTGRDAVKSGHADKLAYVKCDSSLSGTYTKNVKTFFGSFEVTFSKCPLIVYPINVIASNEKSDVQELIEYYTSFFNNKVLSK